MPPSVAETQQRQAQLSPAFCLTTEALRQFLRQSRALIDDPISQHLSALSRPGSTPFHPLTSLPPSRTSSSSRLSGPICKDFVNQIMLPSWNERNRVLRYCSDVSNQEDKDDPLALQLQLEKHKKESMLVNERLDPYSARFQVSESRRDRLKRVLAEESSIEAIVRHRTLDVIASRCNVPGLRIETRGDGSVFLK